VCVKQLNFTRGWLERAGSVARGPFKLMSVLFKASSLLTERSSVNKYVNHHILTCTKLHDVCPLELAHIVYTYYIYTVSSPIDTRGQAAGGVECMQESHKLIHGIFSMVCERNPNFNFLKFRVVAKNGFKSMKGCIYLLQIPFLCSHGWGDRLIGQENVENHW